MLVHISISLRLRSPACCTRVQSRSPSTLCLITFTHLHHAAGRPPHPVALHILFLAVAHLSKCEHVCGAGSGAAEVASARGLVLLSFHSHRFGGGCGHWTRRSGRLPQRQRMTAAPVNAAPSSMESECRDGGDRCYLLLDGEPSLGSCQASPAAPSLGEGTKPPPLCIQCHGPDAEPPECP